MNRFEQDVVDGVRAQLSQASVTGLTFLDAYIRGAADDSEIVVLFGHLQRPGCTFGFAMGTAEVDPLASRGDARFLVSVVVANLQELIEAADRGLPECDAQSPVTWLGP